jgi:histidyl-tRNA synthetase
MKPLSGFRDLLPDDCARRRYLTEGWRHVARRYGFVEFDGPTLESLELYQKKNSGGEILTQLYQFTDRGDRPVALRPEMTPTLARIVAAHDREFVKPLRWFNVGNCFRYERQQRGRLREFLQLNCDLLGEQSSTADAEVIALLIDLLRHFGFGPDDVMIRISDRRAWSDFLEQFGIQKEKITDFLNIVDKMEREPQEKTEEKLAVLGSSALTVEKLQDFIASSQIPVLEPLFEELAVRGLRDFIKPDLSIVRGLAYYTGVVFEAFALRGGLRAVAGGGRYDRLIHDLSQGAVTLPAIGFGMGDAVMLEFLKEVPVATQREEAFHAATSACEVYLVIADEAERSHAVSLAQQLRDAGLRVAFSLAPERIGKQFSAAENSGASFAVIIGSEWPQLKVKRLSTREEVVVPVGGLIDWLSVQK